MYDSVESLKNRAFRYSNAENNINVHQYTLNIRAGMVAKEYENNVDISIIYFHTEVHTIVV